MPSASPSSIIPTSRSRSVFLVAIGIGVVCGVVNGAIVTIARVPSLVVTLGTLYVIRGITAAWAGGNQVGAASLPDSFGKIGYGTIFGFVPYLGIFAIVGRRDRDVRDAHLPDGS